MFNKKNKRKITVDGKVYYWSATGDDGWINLYIMSDTPSSPKLICYFHYHQDETEFDHDGLKGVTLTNQFVITPYTVKQAIEYGLSQGWEPFKRGKDLRLGHIDDYIDLRLDKNKENSVPSEKVCKSKFF
ncbi:hypothetical protein [Zooshikella ganghwensis]|uniref:Uncharacterized protein n=1 Tax=Zooshikella ganghwensis TaxID=202772 RepID=A0A4P9VLP8_9GAMM|nr:hypothetical protein [Zooshikella ganghwensis]RDH43040.1 hypothetical protein B9G39_06005 [Zooshikella ganghwensis]